MNSEITEEQKERVVLRLNKMEGQIRGIRKMIEDGRNCEEVLSQVAAVKGAMNSLSAQIAEAYIRGCMLEKLDGKVSDEAVDSFVAVFRKLQGQG